MRYYRYENSLGFDFAGIEVADLPDGGIVKQLRWDNSPRVSSWTPLTITDVDDVEEDGTKLEPGDFPGLSNYCALPVFSGRAWEVLSRHIDCRWEALPLIPPAWTQLYLIHVMETIDCVDLDRSEVTRYSSGGVMQIERFCLKRETLEGKHIFKTPQGSGLDLLVDDVFREIVLQNGLRGLQFREIPMVRSPGTQER